MPELAARKCVPCRGGVPPLRADQIQVLLAQVNGWEVVGQHHIAKHYSFPDFALALAFVNRIGQVAETEGHHPDISLTWGKVGVEIWTHKIDGLTESDFILAAKLDQIPRE
jgi:4a-hydroxytetrahydrobiopterin dehydratase